VKLPWPFRARSDPSTSSLPGLGTEAQPPAPEADMAAPDLRAPIEVDPEMAELLRSHEAARESVPALGAQGGLFDTVHVAAGALGAVDDLVLLPWAERIAASHETSMASLETDDFNASLGSLLSFPGEGGGEGDENELAQFQRSSESEPLALWHARRPRQAPTQPVAGAPSATPGEGRANSGPVRPMAPRAPEPTLVDGAWTAPPNAVPSGPIAVPRWVTGTGSAEPPAAVTGVVSQPSPPLAPPRSPGPRRLAESISEGSAVSPASLPPAPPPELPLAAPPLSPRQDVAEPLPPTSRSAPPAYTPAPLPVEPGAPQTTPIEANPASSVPSNEPLPPPNLPIAEATAAIAAANEGVPQRTTVEPAQATPAEPSELPLARLQPAFAAENAAPEPAAPPDRAMTPVAMPSTEGQTETPGIPPAAERPLLRGTPEPPQPPLAPASDSPYVERQATRLSAPVPVVVRPEPSPLETPAALPLARRPEPAASGGSEADTVPVPFAAPTPDRTDAPAPRPVVEPHPIRTSDTPLPSGVASVPLAPNEMLVPQPRTARPDPSMPLSDPARPETAGLPVRSSLPPWRSQSAESAGPSGGTTARASQPRATAPAPRAAFDGPPVSPPASFASQLRYPTPISPPSEPGLDFGPPSMSPAPNVPTTARAHSPDSGEMPVAGPPIPSSEARQPLPLRNSPGFEPVQGPATPSSRGVPPRLATRAYPLAETREAPSPPASRFDAASDLASSPGAPSQAGPGFREALPVASARQTLVGRASDSIGESSYRHAAPLPGLPRLSPRSPTATQSAAVQRQAVRDMPMATPVSYRPEAAEGGSVQSLPPLSARPATMPLNTPAPAVQRLADTADSAAPATGSITSAGPEGAAALPAGGAGDGVDIEKLTDRVWQQIRRRLQIERERRHGLS
jgi:hypothetical protein